MGQVRLDWGVIVGRLHRRMNGGDGSLRCGLRSMWALPDTRLRSTQRRFLQGLLGGMGSFPVFGLFGGLPLCALRRPGQLRGVLSRALGRLLLGNQSGLQPGLPRGMASGLLCCLVRGLARGFLGLPPSIPLGGIVGFQLGGLRRSLLG